MWRGIVFVWLIMQLLACGGQRVDDSATSSAGSKAQSDYAKFRQSCRCRECDLAEVDLSGYRPAEDKRFSPKTVGDHYVSTRCDMSQSNLTKANLKNCNLSARSPNYCTVSEAKGCDSYLAQTKAIHANFTEADLSDAMLINITFNKSNFHKANLSNAEVTQSHFANVDFTEANLSNSKAYKDNLLGLQADMRNANFSKANLSGANLTAIFTGASFRGANLKGAYLNTDESFSGGLLPWQKVNFIFADLTGAMIGVNKVNGKHVPKMAGVVIKNAILCRTIMPDGREENRDCRTSQLQHSDVG